MRTYLFPLIFLGLSLAPGQAQVPGPKKPAASPEKPTLVVASKQFTESRLMAEVLALHLEAELGIQVERKIGLGGTQIAFSALTQGEVDLYPEYTGTAWAVLLKRTDRVQSPLQAFVESDLALRHQHQVGFSAPFGFNNTYALAVREETAQSFGLKTISDLIPHLAQLKTGLTHEFLNRNDGFPGLAKAYDFPPVKLSGLDHALAYEGLSSGRIDLVDAYSTDGKLNSLPVRLLADDRAFFPPYQCAPLVRLKALETYPKMGPALAKLGFRLSDAQMRRWNDRADQSGGDVSKVARELLAFLFEGKEAPDADSPGSSASEASQGDRSAQIWARIQEHALLTFLGTLLASALAIPLGILLTRFEGLAWIVLGAVGIFQTIPSLALLAFLVTVPGMGIGTQSAIAALFLYALLPILRNTYTGIREVDPRLVEAARGLGLTDLQLLWHLELPLATRTIMAGVRTAAVIGVGVATLAAFIGAGGLGDPILTGLQLRDNGLVLSGALPAAGMAILLDAVLGRLEAWLAPEGASTDPGGGEAPS